MINTGVISFGSGAVLFLILTLVLLTGQQGQSRKNALKFASIISTAWLGFTALSIYYEAPFFSYLVEPVRSFSWLLFLGYVLVSSVTDTHHSGRRFRRATLLVAGFTLLLVGIVLLRLFKGAEVTNLRGVDVLYSGFLLLAIAGLVLVEQIMRNAHVESRRAVKYLCIGLGIMFAYDFYLYSTALLFQVLDVTIWEVRGFVNALVVPVLAVAIARDPSRPVFAGDGSWWLLHQVLRWRMGNGCPDYFYVRGRPCPDGAVILRTCQGQPPGSHQQAFLSLQV
jgi:hypothetical protein